MNPEFDYAHVAFSDGNIRVPHHGTEHKRVGETIPFIEEPPIETLGEWRKKHPDTVVLLGSKKAIESADRG